MKKTKDDFIGFEKVENEHRKSTDLMKRDPSLKTPSTDKDDKNKGKLSIDHINTFISNLNNLVSNLTEFVDSTTEFLALKRDILRIEKESQCKLEAIRGQISLAMEREMSKRKALEVMVVTYKSALDQILERALNTDLSSCTDKEFDFVMKLIDNCQEQLDKMLTVFKEFLVNA